MNSQFTIISTPYVLLKSQIPAGEPFPASELVAKGPAVVYAIRRPGWGQGNVGFQRGKPPSMKGFI